MFDPREYYAFASKLYAYEDSQECYRTTVSRAYYAAFLVARDKRNLSSVGEGGHLRVVDNLRNSTDIADIKTGNRLDSLRTLRTKADYKCQESLVKREAGESLALSQKILEHLG